MLAIEPNLYYVYDDLCVMLPSQPHRRTVQNWVSKGILKDGQRHYLKPTNSGNKVYFLGDDILRFIRVLSKVRRDNHVDAKAIQVANKRALIKQRRLLEILGV